MARPRKPRPEAKPARKLARKASPQPRSEELGERLPETPSEGGIPTLEIIPEGEFLKSQEELYRPFREAGFESGFPPAPGEWEPPPEEPTYEELFKEHEELCAWAKDVKPLGEEEKRELVKIFDEVRAKGGSPRSLFGAAIRSPLLYGAFSEARKEALDDYRKLRQTRGKVSPEREEAFSRARAWLAFQKERGKRSGLPGYLGYKDKRKRAGRFPLKGPYIWPPIIVLVDYLKAHGSNWKEIYMLTARLLLILAPKFFDRGEADECGWRPGAEELAEKVKAIYLDHCRRWHRQK